MYSVLPPDFHISWDVKAPYHRVFIDPDDRRYLTFSVGGHTYEAITMPFGLSVAPWAWTKITRPVVAALWAAHFQLIGYVHERSAATPGWHPSPARHESPPCPGCRPGTGRRAVAGKNAVPW